MTSRSIVRRAFLAAMTIFFLRAVLSAGAPPEEEGIRRVSPRFGLWGAGESPDGKEHFVVFGDQGDVARVIPLKDQVARYGDGDAFALVTPDRAADEQRVEVFRANGDLISRFRIPLSRTLHVGRNVLVLRPNNDHGRGIPFDLEFLRLDGSRLRALRHDGQVLFPWWMYPNDHWLVASVDRRGEPPERAVRHIDSEGRLDWTFELGEEVPNLCALAPSGDYAVIGTHSIEPVTDTLGDRFRILDSSGSLITSGNILGLQLVGFSPDETHVVLVDKRAIRILETADGSAILSSALPAEPAHLHALAFAPDGSRFHLLGQDLDSNAHPTNTWLITYSIAPKIVTHSKRILRDLPFGRRLIVVRLEVSPNGAVTLTTQQAGIYRVTP